MVESQEEGIRRMLRQGRSNDWLPHISQRRYEMDGRLLQKWTFHKVLSEGN